jgi:putative membrane protein
VFGAWAGVVVPMPAAAHGDGVAIELPTPPPTPTVAEQGIAAARGAVILGATPAEHQVAIADAWAHPERALTEIDLHASIVIGVGALSLLYAWGVGPARRRWRLGPRASRQQVVCFSLAMLLLLVSLNGPMHHLSDFFLLSVHMLQHMLLALLFPPLLLAGIPGWLFSPLLRRDGWRRFGRFLTRPMTAFLLFNFTMIGWHVPQIYELALRDHDVHIAQHLMFLVTAVILWWPISGPAVELPRLTYLWQIAYLFIMQLPMIALGAVLTMADGPIYPFYATAPRVFSFLPPLEDQQLAGLFMWLPGHLVLWIPMGMIFFRWWRAQSDEATGLAPGRTS